jgi:hypothetical protein
MPARKALMTHRDVYLQFLEETTKQPVTMLNTLMDRLWPADRDRLRLHVRVTDAEGRRLAQRLRQGDPAALRPLVRAMDNAKLAEEPKSTWAVDFVTRVLDCGVQECLSGFTWRSFLADEGTEDEALTIYVFERVTGLYDGRDDGARVLSGFLLNVVEIVELFDQEPEKPRVTFKVPMVPDGFFFGPHVAIEGRCEGRSVLLYLYANPPTDEKPSVGADSKGKFRELQEDAEDDE